MRYDDERLAGGKTRDGALYLVLVFRVGERRCFVQDDDGRVFQDRARDGYALAFAAGKKAPCLAGGSAVAAREAFHEFVATCGAGGARDFLVGRLWLSEADVVPDGGIEEEIVLLHEADEFGKLVERHVSHVRAAHRHGAGIDVPVSGDKPRKRGLARPRWPDECGERPLGHRQRHPVQDLFARLVGEAHVLHLHGEARRFRAGFWLGKFGQVEELGGVGDRVLHGLHLVHERREAHEGIHDGKGKHDAHGQA